MLIVYLVILITASYWVVKTLAPEMAKPPLPRKRPSPKPDLIDFSQLDGPGKRIEKLETLLAEKNKNIGLLQKELRVFYVQVQAFDKVKVLLDEEIHRLREQNRIFRSELGIPPIASSRGNMSDLENSRNH